MMECRARLLVATLGEGAIIHVQFSLSGLKVCPFRGNAPEKSDVSPQQPNQSPFSYPLVKGR